MKNFPHYLQLDAKDCGPTCLRMIAKHYGKEYSLQTLRERSYITREGVSMLGVSEAAESIGFRTIGVTHHTEAVTGRYTASLYPALEAEPFRSVLRHQEEAQGVCVLYSRPCPSTDNIR